MTRNFRPGDIVRHFKYHWCTDEEKRNDKYMYQIVGVATHSETKEKLMVYRALYDPWGLFARPYDMFVSEVDHEKYPDAKQKYRMEIVNDANVRRDDE